MGGIEQVLVCSHAQRPDENGAPEDSQKGRGKGRVQNRALYQGRSYPTRKKGCGEEGPNGPWQAQWGQAAMSKERAAGCSGAL
jgi:hypothetical protein